MQLEVSEILVRKEACLALMAGEQNALTARTAMLPEQLQQSTGDGHQHQQVEAAMAERRGLCRGWSRRLRPGLSTPHRGWGGLLEEIMT